MTLKPEHIVEALNKTPELKRRLILRIMEELLDSEAFMEAYPRLYDPAAAEASPEYREKVREELAQIIVRLFHKNKVRPDDAEEALNRARGTYLEMYIEKAVSWWAGKLMDHQPHSNGDDSFTSVAVCFLADTMRQSVTLDQLNTFKAALAKSIEEYAKSIQAFGFSIGSDYGPCKMLADAAAEAGIDRANFPFKTTMFFTEKEGVLVRDGYGAPAVRIC